MVGAVRLTIAVAALALAARPAAAGELPSVVASIKPLHSLVAGVMDGLGEPVVVVQGQDVPYSYALRPADNLILGKADIVVWVGAAMERFLVRPLVPLSRRARVITLLEQDGVEVLRFSPAGRNLRGEADPHLWLDIGNAKRLVASTVAALGAADSRHKRQYATNGRRLVARLADLDRRIADSLQPLRHVPYVVYHDVFRYFERRYGLAHVGALTPSARQSPDTFRLSEMRQTIFTFGVRCVFVEPDFDQAQARALVHQTGARLAVVDPFGIAVAAGPEAYFQILGEIAQSMSRCLRRPG